MPPLRERLEDLPLLVDYFLHVYGRAHDTAASEFSSEALDALLAYRWPGNIRELKNVVERAVLKAAGPIVKLADLPGDVFKKPAARVGAGQEGSNRSTVADLTAAMLQRGEDFWSVVYPPFMARDLTRDQSGRIVQTGLESTNGNYRLLVRLFNMAPDDYKRFLGFLRKHDCHLPFQRFRTVPARLEGATPPRSYIA